MIIGGEEIHEITILSKGGERMLASVSDTGILNASKKEVEIHVYGKESERAQDKKIKNTIKIALNTDEFMGLNNYIRH